MNDTGLTVFIVDDDAAVRDSLSLLLSLRGYATATFESAHSFLDALRPGWSGCLFADIRMPGMDGLGLQAELAARGVAIPVVIMTAHGDVATARAAFRADAVDFLEKPFEEAPTVAAVEAAFARERARLSARQAEAVRTDSLAALTQREREVAELLAVGMHNREIAQKLDISPRTVEIHKARVMAKLGVSNVVELIRLTGLR